MKNENILKRIAYLCKVETKIMMQNMKHLALIFMVLLMTACSGQAPKTETVNKDSIVTARDVAKEKLEKAQLLKDSLETVLQKATEEEAAHAAWVMENATKLAANAPEVERLNRMRMHLDTLKKQYGLVDGQIRYLKRVMNIE